MNKAEIKNKLNDIKTRIESGDLLRNQRNELNEMKKAVDFDSEFVLYSYLKTAADANTKKRCIHFINNAINEINSMTTIWKEENLKNCKTCRFNEKKYDSTSDCVTFQTQCIRCKETDAHQTQEDYNNQENERKDKSMKSAAAAAKAMKIKAHETGTKDCMIVESAHDTHGNACTIKVGDMIRTWDFEPCPGRRNAYIEGEFLGYSEDGRLHVKVEKDTLAKKGQRLEIFTPQKNSLIFGEYNGRITKLNDGNENAPRIIQSIYNMICEKPMSIMEICCALMVLFPEKDDKKMIATIKAQVPRRIVENKEKTEIIFGKNEFGKTYHIK